MYDLIYGGNKYKEELYELFPTAKFEDASDEIHEDRISIEVDLEEKDFLRIIILNGFLDLSLHANLFVMDSDNKDKISSWIEEWKRDYPQYFK